MANPESNEPKKQLRREMRLLLSGIIGDTGKVLPKVRDWITARPQLGSAAVYSPLPGEIDLTPLVTDFPEIRWAFPRIEGPHLVMHRVRDISTDLESGAFGIREPRTDLPVIPFSEIDAFFCPGLAFDPSGGRLGRGRGFYDRMLGQARGDALKIGVSHAVQIVPLTFGEAHDIVMDEVISG